VVLPSDELGATVGGKGRVGNGFFEQLSATLEGSSTIKSGEPSERVSPDFDREEDKQRRKKSGAGTQAS